MSEKQFQFRKIVGKFKIGTYLKDLSVVIIGIFITLFITDKLNNASKQREIKESLFLVQSELMLNLEQIKGTEELYFKDKELLEILYENMDDIKAVPVTLLENQMDQLGHLYTIYPFTDAFDIFKLSGLLPYVEDRAFLVDLLRVCNSLSMIQEFLNFYLEIKQASHNGFDSKVLALLNGDDFENDPHSYFSIVLESEEMRSFILKGRNAFDPESFEKLGVRIEQMIERIDKEYLK